MLKVGLVETLVHTRFGPTALPRANYLTAVATGMDSFWLPDHLNSLLPRSVMTPKYVGAARLVPDVDAYLEPWGNGLAATFALAIRVGAFAHAIAWIRQREALPEPARPNFDLPFRVVLRRAIAQTLVETSTQ